MINGKGKIKSRFLAMVLAASLAVVLAGCGGEDGPGSEAGKQEASGDEDGKKAMGRYVEEEIDLSDLTVAPDGICMRDDGSIVLLDSYKGFLVSKDDGRTWENEVPAWLEEMMQQQYYIGEMAMSPDGTVAVVYDSTTGDDDYTPVMKLILPDGTCVPVEPEITEDDMQIRSLYMSEDNRIFFNTFGMSVYEVFTDGSSEKVLDAEERPYWFWVKDNLLYIDNDYGKGKLPLIYDMEAEEYIEDTVLTDFVSGSYGERYYNGSDYGTMVLLPEEEQTLYVFGNQGIHRHVVGGNLMEQIVDGKLSMLSNPSYTICDVMRLEGDVFLVMFSNGRLIRYTYDPNVPAVPEKELTIYSLREDEDLRQAVSLYQAKHPDTYVSYEVGMFEDGSVTREDAIKKLNTEVMAGNGPDLIVMDDLPFQSYISKGLLFDLTDYLAQYGAQEPLFDNVIEALKVDGKAYVAPATFGVPRLAGKGSDVSGMTDLAGIAAGVEKMRSDHPGDDIIGICDAETVLKRFAMTSAPLWISENGSLNREEIGAFLEQAKRIYDAQMDGIRAEILQDYAEEDKFGYSGTVRVDWDLANDIFSYISGSQYLINGWIDTAYGYMESESIKNTAGYEDSSVIPMQGTCSGLFRPKTMLGINAASAQTEEAKEFMGFFLSAEVQQNYYGLPLNQNAYEIQITPHENYMGEDRAYSYLSLMNEDGVVVNFTVYGPTDEQIAAFKEELSSVNTAYFADSMLEDAVFTSGVLYVQGEASLEETLREIEKQVAIYMAE